MAILINPNMAILINPNMANFSPNITVLINPKFFFNPKMATLFYIATLTFNNHPYKLFRSWWHALTYDTLTDTWLWQTPLPSNLFAELEFQHQSIWDDVLDFSRYPCNDDITMPATLTPWWARTSSTISGHNNPTSIILNFFITSTIKTIQTDATNITNNEQGFYRRSLESNLKSDVVTASIRILTWKMRSNGPSAKSPKWIKVKKNVLKSNV